MNRGYPPKKVNKRRDKGLVDRGVICTNRDCKLRKKGCRGFEGCPGYKGR